ILFYTFINYYDELKIELDRWELIGTEEAKMLIMDYVVRDFFILFSTVFNKLEFIESLEEDELFSFLNSYVEKDAFNETLRQYYKDFSGIFSLPNDMEVKLETLKLLLIKTYKFFKINDLNKIYLEQDVKLNEKISSLEKELTEMLKSDPLTSAFALSCNNESQITKKTLLNLSYPTQLIEQLSGTDLVDYIKINFVRILTPILMENGFYYTKINYLEDNLIERIVNIYEELQEDDDIKIDSIIGGYFDREYLLSKQTESIKDRFVNIVNSLKNEIEVNVPLIIGVDSEKGILICGPLSVSAKYKSDEEISRELKESNKDSNGNYLLNLTNNIFAPFTEKEAYDYIKKKTIIFSINLPFEYNSKSNGFIIEFR
ncbi:hypothetical protein V7127_10710, partial [Bacillus sp. JJ1773]|uniref:hypothetical protein n=1 Tax=Bacillus sp. JJ1773 TaxID=3122965 RepID=UPI002FFFCCBC